MYCDILKNPIIIGILVGVIVYFFMKHKNKKNKKNKNKKKVSLIIPVISAIIAGFMVWSIDGSMNVKNNVASSPNKSAEISLPTQEIIKQNIDGSNPLNISGGVIDGINLGQPSDKLQSCQLIGKGIHVPTTLPDAFLDMDMF